MKKEVRERLLVYGTGQLCFLLVVVFSMGRCEWMGSGGNGFQDS